MNAFQGRLLRRTVTVARRAASRVESSPKNRFATGPARPRVKSTAAPSLSTVASALPSVFPPTASSAASLPPFHLTARSLSSTSSPVVRPENEIDGTFDKISFVGSGKMAEALISPLIETSVQPPEKIAVYDVSNATMKRIASHYEGVQTASSIPEVIDGSDLIVCAVKPQNCNVVFSEVRRARTMPEINVRDDAMLLSIVAGKPIKEFVEGTGLERVARSMPNTPAQIGKGVTVWTCTGNVDGDDRDRIKDVLGTFGKSIFVDDESFIDMSTSISGSGPAYIFMLMEAMIDAGVHMGFSRDTATTLVHQTLLGSTLYAMETGEHPAILRNSVTSPAGTTASAMYELEAGRFRTVIKDAIWACYRRSLEMGGHDSNVGPGRTYQPASMPQVHHPVEAPSGECVDDDNGNGK